MGAWACDLTHEAVQDFAKEAGDQVVVVSAQVEAGAGSVQAAVMGFCVDWRPN